MFGSEPMVRDKCRRSNPGDYVRDKMTVCLGRSEVEPSTVQVEHRPVKSTRRRMNPRPRDTANRVGFERHAVRRHTLSIKASNGSRAAIPRSMPLVELVMARMAATVGASSGSRGCVTTKSVDTPVVVECCIINSCNLCLRKVIAHSEPSAAKFCLLVTANAFSG
jgi:hypothetical protein